MAVSKMWAGPLLAVNLLAMTACGDDGADGDAAGDPTRACEEFRSYVAGSSGSSFADDRADVGRIVVKAREDGAEEVAEAAKLLNDELTAADRLIRDPDRDYVELAEVDGRLAAAVNRLNEVCKR